MSVPVQHLLREWLLLPSELQTGRLSSELQQFHENEMFCMADSLDVGSSSSFGALLTQLGTHGGQLIPPAEEFLVKNAARLKRCADPFKRPESSSRAKVDAGKLTGEDGVSISLGANEKQVVRDISDRLAIDEVEAALLLRALRRHQGEDENKDVALSTSKDDGFWETLTAFFFEERLAIIHVLAHVLRSVDLEGQTSPAIYATIVADVALVAFAKTLLDRVVVLATTPIPSTSIPFTSFWAKQYVREQKALIEVYFLLHYNKIFPNGQSLLDVLLTVKQTEWGCKQINEGYFDADAYSIARDVTYLLILVCVENLNLERAASPEANELAIIPGAALAEDALLHPTMLQKVHNEIVGIAASQPQQSGPLLLAWSFVLSRITESMTSVPLPEAYYEIASEILPLELHPRRNVEHASANRSNQPVYQQLASHALSPNVALLPTIHTLLSSSLLLSPSSSSSSSSLDPNVPGYLSVARSLVSVLPLLVHPSFLPPADFDALISVVQVLYANPAAGLLRGQFWGLFDLQEEDEVVRGEWEIVEVAKSRFPVQIGQFLQLLKALSGGPSRIGADPEDAQLAQRCSERVKEYLATVSTLTQALPPMPSVLPLPYEASSAIDAGPLDVVSLRPIPVSASVSVPANVPGRFVSEQDRRPIIVSWDLSATRAGGFSAWRLLGDMLDAFVGSRRSTSSRRQQQSGTAVDVFSGGSNEDAPPIKWDSEEDQIQDISAVLEIIRDVLSHTPAQITDTLTLLSNKPEENTVQTFLLVLEKAMAMQSIRESITIPTTRILQALLRSYPSQIWNYVRSSGMLFPLDSAASAPTWGSRLNTSTRSTLVQNKASGIYGQTLANIDFVSSLAKHAQTSALMDSVAMSELKSDVLKRALRWCLDSLWTSFSSWRFADAGQKYEMGSKLARLFQSVLVDVDCGISGRARGTSGSAEFLLNAFLVNASAARLAPLVTSIANGLQSVSFMTRPGRHGDALASEDCTKACLQLVQRLLSLSRRVLPNQPTLLEKILFSHSNDKTLSNMLSSASSNGEDLIAILFRYIHMAPNASLGVYSARVLSQVCRLSLDWGQSSDRPSLLGHLGGVKETEKTIEAILSIAGDPFIEANVQSATWELMTDIIEAQPGLADVLISGQKALVQLVDPARSEGAGSSTGIALAVQVLEGWEEAWEAQPALLSAALTFLCSVWNNYIDSNGSLHTLRKDSNIWTNLGKVIGKTIEQDSDPMTLEDVDADAETEVQIERSCYRKSAKAAATRLVALDAQYAVSRAEDGKPVQDASLTVLSDLLASKEAFLAVILSATTSQFDPTLTSDTQKAFSESFNGLQLDAYQVSVSQQSAGKLYGKDFLYISGVLHDRFEGLSEDLEDDAVSNAIRRVNVLNLSMSALDADSSLLSAWNVLLEVALPKVAESRAVGESLWTAIREVAKRAGEDSRTGSIAEEMHGERLRSLKTMLEYASRRTVTAGPSDIPTMVEQIRKILTNESLNPLQSLRVQSPSSYHRVTFQVAYLLFYKFSTSLDKSTVIPREKTATILSDTETSLGVAFSAVRVCVLLASQAADPERISEDLSLCTSLVQQILGTSIRPRPTVWLAYCQELDLFRNIFDFVSSAPLKNGYESMVSNILELCLALAGFPQAAEKMALEGLATCLNNNALTAILEEGALQPTSSAGDADSRHQIWCSMQAVMTQLVVSLGESIPFMENEVSAFARLYSRQMYRCYHWTTNDPLTTATLRELQNTSTLFNKIISTRTSVPALQPILRKQITASLSLLQQLVYLLQHPNLLSTLLEPSSSEERFWLSSESDADANISLNDLHNRLVAASILQEVFKLCYILVATLVTYTKAFTVLTRDTLDWPNDKAIVQANANVSLDEPATLGTLFDLARFCTDAARYCNTSSSSSITPATSPLPPYDPTLFLEMTANTLEATLLLMSTQIALTVQQQDAANGGVPSSDRAAQRARRDLKELAGDMVEEFLDRSSSGSGAGDARQPQGQEKNLMTVLKTFVLML